MARCLHVDDINTWWAKHGTIFRSLELVMMTQRCVPSKCTHFSNKTGIFTFTEFKYFLHKFRETHYTENDNNNFSMAFYFTQFSQNLQPVPTPPPPPTPTPHVLLLLLDLYDAINRVRKTQISAPS